MACSKRDGWNQMKASPVCTVDPAQAPPPKFSGVSSDYEILGASHGLILHDATGQRWRITVDTDGALITTNVGAVPEPTIPSYLGPQKTPYKDKVFSCARDFEILAIGKGLILQDTSGQRWRITIDTDGALITGKVL